MATLENIILDAPLKAKEKVEEETVYNDGGIFLVSVKVDGKSKLCGEKNVIQLKEFNAKYPDATTIEVKELGPMWVYRYTYDKETGWNAEEPTKGYA